MPSPDCAAGEVVLLFTRTRTLHSLAVRLFTGSPWSHVEFIDGTNVIGALPGGVAVDSLRKRLAEVSAYQIVRVPCAEPLRVLTACYSQLGKPYDFLGILGLVTRRRRWQKASSWFCSELVSWCFAAVGQPLFREEQVWRVTPQHLWMLQFPEPTRESAAARSLALALLSTDNRTSELNP